MLGITGANVSLKIRHFPSSRWATAPRPARILRGARPGALHDHTRAPARLTGARDDWQPTITDCNQKHTARQMISRVQTVGDLASLQYGLRDSRISTGTCPAGSSKRVMLASVPAHIANGSPSRLAPPQRQAVQVLLHSQNLWKTLWIQLYGTG